MFGLHISSNVKYILINQNSCQGQQNICPIFTTIAIGAAVNGS